jgi:phage head maturation protease
MAWDGSASRFTDEQYARSCVLDRGPSVESVKARYSLPVKEPSGELNCDGVSSALGYIGQVKNATPEQIAAARRKLEALSAQCKSQSSSSSSESRSRPTPGEVETRALPDLVAVEEEDGTRRLRGRIPYGVESREFPGGWREVIDAGALNSADLGDLVVTVDHAGVPLGRHPRTLELEDRSDGLHWAVEPPRSRADIVEAVERGDIRDTSWRMIVKRDRWEGDVRHVEEIRALRDVALVSQAGAYAEARAELRARPAQVPSPELGDQVDLAQGNPRRRSRPPHVRLEGPVALRVRDQATMGAEVGALNMTCHIEGRAVIIPRNIEGRAVIIDFDVEAAR